jgi:hypothetical protein
MVYACDASICRAHDKGILAKLSHLPGWRTEPLKGGRYGKPLIVLLPGLTFPTAIVDTLGSCIFGKDYFVRVIVVSNYFVIAETFAVVALTRLARRSQRCSTRVAGFALAKPAQTEPAATAYSSWRI